jgi:putative phosphoribosyl transferase
MIMVFASREDAGQRLGRRLKEEGIVADMVLGLPRGGLIVAAQVAQELGLPLDVLVVRKIGHPWFREFALGALAEDGIILLDEKVISRNPVARSELDQVVEEELDRLAAYDARFHRQGKPDLQDKAVILVDDGLATGATTEAAVLSARARKARRVFVAAPVASAHAVERLSHVADSVEVLWEDPDFDAVGRYYESFAQTSDQEVNDVLEREAKTRREAT